MSRYPLLLELEGQPVLVVGAGAVAARRLDALLAAGAVVTVVAPTDKAGIGDRNGASGHRFTFLPRAYARADVRGVRLVHACTDDPGVNADVARHAREEGVWCVRADDANASEAWVPATATVDDITVSVSAGGDPARAVALRNAVVRRLHAGTLNTGTEHTGTEHTGTEHTGTEHTRPRRPRPGVVLVGGGPGSPGLLTLRGYRALLDADVVVTDRLGPRELLDTLPAEVEIVDVGKTPRGPGTAQEEINRLLVERALAGQRVVRLKGGDPFVFGRGAEEVRACMAAGVPVEVVPGVSSATAAPVAAGVPLTHRGITQEFLVAAGHLPPGDPGSTVDWSAVGAGSATVVLLMAVEHLPVIASALRRGGRPGSTPVAAIENASLPDERVVVTTLEAIASEEAGLTLRPPAVVVIGDVVGLRAGSAPPLPSAGHPPLP